MTTKNDVIRKIEALLAKAGSTEFSAEAEALAAKAQELMIAYMVDEGELGGNNNSEVVKRVVPVSGAWSLDRIRLLQNIGSANGLLALRTQGHNDHAELYGRSDTIDMVVSLWRTLDLQLVRHLATVTPPWGENTRSFRHAFILGFNMAVTTRLRERIKTAEDDTPGVGLVLADRRSDAERLHAELHPRAKLVRRSASFSSSSGMRAGSQAGSRADLGSSRLPTGPRALCR